MLTRGRLTLGKHDLRVLSSPTPSFSHPSILPSWRIGRSRQSSTESGYASLESKDSKNGSGNSSNNLKPKVSERDLFLSVLSSSATKRDVKSYLSRFNQPTKSARANPAANSEINTEASETQSRRDNTRLNRAAVDLGNLHTPKAIEESPVFTQHLAAEQLIDDVHGPLNIALVKLRAPQLLHEATLDGIAITLSQLCRLGLKSVVVVDCEEDKTREADAGSNLEWRRAVTAQAQRVTSAIADHNVAGARYVDCAVGLTPLQRETKSSLELHDDVQIQYPSMLLGPLRKGVIPVVPPIAYAMPNQHLARVEADDVLLALTREFTGLTRGSSHAKGVSEVADTHNGQWNTRESQVFVDRIILLDPFGGIPATDQPSKAHVFINLEQEYEDIQRELLGTTSPPQAEDESILRSQDPNHIGPVSTLGASNPFSTFVERGLPAVRDAITGQARVRELEELASSQQHIQNLNLLQQALALLPPSSSAIVTTPEEASKSALLSSSEMEVLGVETRRQKNPLIHNLLTDKPTVSSSLPAARLRSSEHEASPFVATKSNPSTFVKRGMPLTIIPDPRSQPWEAPGPNQTQISFHDPRIDLARTLHLIEDSFGRPLDVAHYLNRLSNSTAGVIIAGEYEGGAIFTWEVPPGVTNGGSEIDRGRMVPYLDKFAVLRRSQGAGGVADIVFNAMVRTCFPEGVCWRSRKNNPVNKWYFERAEGTWRLAGSNWTMFWTTKDLVQDKQKWLDYVEVCKAVQPSWADNKSIID